MNGLARWLDDRTGLIQLTRAALYEPIPGGSRWRYVWGSTLVFAFVLQLITGTVLWMCYSPSTRTAWESVYYIQHELPGGWLVRGIHHYTANIMIVLLVLHVIQVVVAGAYRAPREFNFWTGLVLMLIVLGLSLTGYLLPWDQKGYSATSVATSLMTLVPGVGSALQRLVVGGAEYGHHTLTRFFALHAGVLPGLLILLLVAHVALFRRHGITTAPSDRPTEMFWPDQVWKDVVACLVVLGLVLLLCVAPYFRSHDSSLAPGDYLGAELSAPADPSESFAAARPEWYFLFLFQLLKYFEGGSEVIGAIVIPSVAMLVLVLMPFIGRSEFGHRLNLVVLFGLLVAAGVLTTLAVREDMASPDVVAAKHQAEFEAQRIRDFVRHEGGIPWEGAISLMRRDPEIQGPRLFAQYCSSCHAHVDETGAGLKSLATTGDGAEPTGAPNLYGFASREWITRLLNPEHVAGPDYFGATAHREGDMVQFVQGELGELDEASRAALADVVTTVSAEAGLLRQREADQKAADDGSLERGRMAMSEQFLCMNCHRFHDEGELGAAPDLTGYGSLDWMIGMISNPAHERFYSDRNDRMPAFANAEDPANSPLTEDEVRMLAQWLRGDLRNLEQLASGGR